MLNLHDSMSYVKTRILKQIKAKYTFRQELYQFELNSHTIPNIYNQCDFIVGEVTRMVYHEELGTKEVIAKAQLFVPETWWDHFKQDVMPKWMLPYFKEINYKCESVETKSVFDVKMAFPDYVPPMGLHQFVRITEMKGLGKYDCC